MSGQATATLGNQQATATSAIPVATYTVTLLDDTTDSNSGDIDVENFLGTPTWAQMVAAFGFGYNFTKPTEAGTSHRTGDDKDIEDTIFTTAVRTAEGLKSQNTLASFLVLNENNSFDTTVRFTDELGTEVFTNTYTVDNYTGLGWFITPQGISNWNTAIDAAIASTQNSFTNWFVPNLSQLMSIQMLSNASGLGSLDYAPFNYDFPNTTSLGTGTIFSSTTLPNDSTRAKTVIPDLRVSANFRPNVNIALKTATCHYLLCRQHIF